MTTLLLSCGFAQVVTPIVMAKGMLNKMGLDNAHPLFSQIFWLNSKQCLRPMLAPHLYYLIKDLLRLWEKPIQIFEVGPCFRKESRGATHSNEFTMVNLTEFGLAEEDRIERIQELAIRILETIEIEEYRFETSSSEVYGETIDVLAGPNEVEVASCAMGPHPLDQNWRLHECWIGLGFGLERLLLAKAAHANISKMGRSLSYLDGIRLNI